MNKLITFAFFLSILGTAQAQVSQRAGAGLMNNQNSTPHQQTAPSTYNNPSVRVSNNNFVESQPIWGYPVDREISKVYNSYGAFVAIKDGSLPPGFKLNYNDQTGSISLRGNTYIGNSPNTPAGTYKFTIRVIGQKGQVGGNYANNHHGDYQDIDCTIHFLQFAKTNWAYI